MSNKDLCKGEHLKIEDRLIIEYGLDQNYTLKEIAERVFDKNAFTARNIDLPRKVKYKPRKKSTLPVIKESTHRIGRTFNDFVKFIEDNPNLLVVEMDTVHGTRSGKVLFTFMLRNCSLMIAFIIDSCSQTAVKDAVDKLYEVLVHEVFVSP